MGTGKVWRSTQPGEDAVWIIVWAVSKLDPLHNFQGKKIKRSDKETLLKKTGKNTKKKTRESTRKIYQEIHPEKHQEVHQQKPWEIFEKKDAKSIMSLLYVHGKVQLNTVQWTSAGEH